MLSLSLESAHVCNASEMLCILLTAASTWLTLNGVIKQKKIPLKMLPPYMTNLSSMSRQLDQSPLQLSIASPNIP